MRFLMFLAILTSMLATYLSTSVHLLPSFAKFLPEIVSILTACAVGIRGVHQGFRFASGKYLLTCAALLLVIVCGILANQVAPGPILAGSRYYLRAIPFFFVPAVFDFKDSQIKQLMRLILGLSLLQIPLACFQRYVLATTGHVSGDAVFGSLMASGVLSIFLICVICVMAAMVLRGQMTKVTFFSLFILFVLPMSINETKVTVFALPLGLMVTAIVGSPPHKRISVATHASLAIVAGALIFVPLYDFFNSWNNYDPDRGRIQDFLTNPGGMSSYLDTHATVGSGKEAGRVDAVTVPLQVLAHDPVRLSFGFGIGNATRSNLGPQFTGRYGAIYSAYTVETSMATFMLEIGVFGTILILLLQWFIFRDAIYVMRADQGLVGIIGLGWIGASIIVSACNFYITLHTSEALSYMFWFFSGLIVAKRTRLSLAQPQSYQFAIAAPNNQFGLLK